MTNQTFNSYYLEMTLNIKTSWELLKYVWKLEEENRKLKLHIEAKDKAYTALLKDYEEIKEDNKNLKAEIGERLDAIRQKI